jgi:uncharacterized protein YbbK (DUF523 family)
VDDGSGRQPAIVVSACLLGVRCNHRGEANTSDAVLALRDTHRVIAVCPETMGGLPTPRVAAETRSDGRVVNGAGDDVTIAFERGAAATVRVALVAGARDAVLKARSPSCDCRAGVTARALREAGLDVRSEEDLGSTVRPTP